jgi:hypothetical protein
MRCTQIIKTVLDEIYPEIKGTEADKDAAIKQSLDHLHKRYMGLLKNEAAIDYRDPITRFAYLYRYVTSHANLVFSRIENSPELRSLFERDRLTATCIGGGPGSDFLGIVKYMMNNAINIPIRCFLYDREQVWGETWCDVDDKVGPAFKVATHFQPFDVTDCNTWAAHTKYLNSDLFTMIYFMSEVYGVRDKASSFFENLFNRAQSGSMFLYIDNNNGAFFGWFDELAAQANLISVAQGQGEMHLPVDEEKRDLDPYFTKFGLPKLKPNVAYRICIKL